MKNTKILIFFRVLLFVVICHVVKNSNNVVECFCPTLVLHNNNNHGSFLHRNMVIKTDVMESLDIGPLLKGIAKHAGTKRGYDALIGPILVQSLDEVQLKRQSAHRRSRQWEQPQQQQQPFILKPTQTWKETIKQWQLIQEATILLQKDVYPPIYDAHSSPWDTQHMVDSDDDELFFTKDDNFEKWNQLEAILRAEQVILKLIQTYQWSVTTTNPSSISISTIGQTIPIDSLQRIYQELQDTVKIVYLKQSSMLDPTGSKVSMILIHTYIHYS